MSAGENRLTRLITGLLSQGITPHKVALTLALGVVIGLNPVIGTSTTLCMVLALRFRLNVPLIQLINFLVYPLQILLLIPFVQVGQWMFRQPPLPFSGAQIREMLGAGMWRAIQALWIYALHGLAAWMLLGVLLGGIIYAATLPVLRRVARQH